MKLTDEQMKEYYSEEDGFFCEEASALQLPVGEFPMEIEGEWQGKKLRFRYDREVKDSGDEDLVSLIYKDTQSKLEFHILND